MPVKANKKPARPPKSGAGGVHLIGICGKGTSGLALILKQQGYNVTGSDKEFYEPIHSLLLKNKIRIFRGYSAKNIPKDANLIVVGGKHANLAPENNEEVRAALASGIKIKSVPEVLGEIAAKTENTIIAGSFGKSTATTLLAHSLIIAGKDPSYFIGASPIGWKANAHLGKGRDFILEGDEYPSSNSDSTPKFLHLHPKNLILISAEHDHINIFPKEADYLKPYQKLISLLPKSGLIVATGEGKNVAKLTKDAPCKVVTYGLTKKSIWHPENIKYGAKTSFDLYKGSEKIINLETTQLGNHNIENIVGVSAFLLTKELITPKELQKAMKTFKGLSGRLDLKNSGSPIPVYEGFGSSYTKARSIFDALKLHYPNKKLITIFEPHSGSWSNTLAKVWYKDIFNTTDKLILLPPPAHRANIAGQMNFAELTKEIKKHHKKVFPVRTEKEALALIKKIAKKGDVIALVSSGSLLGLSKSVPRLVKGLF